MFGINFPHRRRAAQRKASLARRARRRLRRRPEQGGGQSAPTGGFQGKLLALHSQARPANYRLNGQLCHSAQAKAEEMNRTNRMSHTNADGSSFDKRITRAGYDWRSCGENIGEGFDDPEGVFRAWMNSPPHRANIMSDKFTEIGFGQSGGYWAAHFGRR